MTMFRLRRALHRIACRFGWHIGGNLAWNTEDGHYLSRCLWCEHEMQWLGGEWREYIRPPRRPFRGGSVAGPATIVATSAPKTEPHHQGNGND